MLNRQVRLRAHIFGGRIFFSKVNFLCLLIFRYPFHPRVTAVDYGHSAHSAGGGLRLNTHAPEKLRGFQCPFFSSSPISTEMVYRPTAERYFVVTWLVPREIAAVSAHVPCTPIRWILNKMKIRYTPKQNKQRKQTHTQQEHHHHHHHQPQTKQKTRHKKDRDTNSE